MQRPAVLWDLQSLRSIVEESGKYDEPLRLQRANPFGFKGFPRGPLGRYETVTHRKQYRDAFLKNVRSGLYFLDSLMWFGGTTTHCVQSPKLEWNWNVWHNWLYTIFDLGVFITLSAAESTKSSACSTLVLCRQSSNHRHGSVFFRECWVNHIIS